MGFIEEIAAYIQKYAPEYGICVCSPIIAQAVLESSSGRSYKATYGHNYFGLKWRSNRCPVSIGKFVDTSVEDRGDHVEGVTDEWFMFRNMEEGVIGYFQFISISNYANLKGITDPELYLKTIKADKYATDKDYVSKNMSVIKKYNLTKYDNVEGSERKMVINVHAGHNPDGKVACGAAGIMLESTEARKLKELVISRLRMAGHTVYDCTVDNGKSQSDVLQQIVKKCNAHVVDLDISIHFNAGANDRTGNGKTTGVECLVYSIDSKSVPYATAICNNIAKIGFRNRGVKIRPDLYFLKHSKAPAVLIETCFVDDYDDYRLYTANVDKVAEAIAASV